MMVILFNRRLNQILRPIANLPGAIALVIRVLNLTLCLLEEKINHRQNVLDIGILYESKDRFVKNAIIRTYAFSIPRIVPAIRLGSPYNG